MITDFFSSELRAMSRELASSRIEEPKLTRPRSHRKLLKEREDETSQLNRLVGAYFHLVYFRFLPPRITLAILSLF
jgi:hypothetical protein